MTSILFLHALGVAAVVNRLAVSPIAAGGMLAARTPCISCVAAAPQQTTQRPRRRNAAAHAVVEKLTRLRSTKSAPVDTEALGRVLRGAGTLNDGTLLEVFLGLKTAGKWQLALALAAMLEAQAPVDDGSGQKRKSGDLSSDPGDVPEFDEGITMADLLGQSAVDRVPGAMQPIHYNVLISICAKPRRWKDALDVHARMQARGVEQTTVTYNTLLNVLEKSSRWKIALKMLKEMQARNVAPNTITFSTAISACARAGEWERALEVFEMMQQVHSPTMYPPTSRPSAIIPSCALPAPFPLSPAAPLPSAAHPTLLHRLGSCRTRSPTQPSSRRASALASGSVRLVSWSVCRLRGFRLMCKC